MTEHLFVWFTDLSFADAARVAALVVMAAVYAGRHILPERLQ